MSSPVVHVVGAGPAGLAAALYLARAGLKPVVFEQAEDVGVALDGVIQCLENWSTEDDALDLLARLGITVNFHCEPAVSATLYGPERRPSPLTSTRPLLYAVERGNGMGALDRGLKEQALAAGAEFRFGERVQESNAAHVIVATGAPSADAYVEWMAFETSYRDACFGFVDEQLAPGGHASLLVHTGRATLSIWCFNNPSPPYEHLERTLQVVQEEIGLDIRSPRRGRGSVNFSVAAPWTRSKGFYLVGARAGFQDALWGFGLRQALLSGVLAARAVAMGENYDDLCSRFILPGRDVSLANRVIFVQLDRRGYEWAIQGAVGRNVMGILRRHYLPSNTKTMLHDIARLSAYPLLTEPACHGDDCQCLWCEHGLPPTKAETHYCVEDHPSALAS